MYYENTPVARLLSLYRGESAKERLENFLDIGMFIEENSRIHRLGTKVKKGHSFATEPVVLTAFSPDSRELLGYAVWETSNNGRYFDIDRLIWEETGLVSIYVKPEYRRRGLGSDLAANIYHIAIDKVIVSSRATGKRPYFVALDEAYRLMGNHVDPTLLSNVFPNEDNCYSIFESMDKTALNILPRFDTLIIEGMPSAIVQTNLTEIKSNKIVMEDPNKIDRIGDISVCFEPDKSEGISKLMSEWVKSINEPLAEAPVLSCKGIIANKDRDDKGTHHIYSYCHHFEEPHNRLPRGKSRKNNVIYGTIGDIRMPDFTSDDKEIEIEMTWSKNHD